MTEITETKKIGHDGRQWETYGPFFDYENCASRAKALFEDLNPKDFDSKVKHLSDGFYLKVREKQSSLDRKAKIEEVQRKLQAEQKSEKKSKKELNKRQRD